MKKVKAPVVNKMVFVGLSMSLFMIGIAQAQAKLPAFRGKFKITQQVQWNETVPQPGDYTIISEF